MEIGQLCFLGLVREHQNHEKNPSREGRGGAQRQRYNLSAVLNNMPLLSHGFLISDLSSHFNHNYIISGGLSSHCYHHISVVYLLMLLHGSVELLGKVIGDIGHPWFFLVGSAQAALVLAGLFIILLFGILAVSFRGL